MYLQSSHSDYQKISTKLDKSALLVTIAFQEMERIKKINDLLFACVKKYDEHRPSQP
jgi:hypothetical protein